MPSPFPGMDPYLEGALWTTVHFSISAEIVRQLAPKLRPRYLVLPAERFVTETPESVAISTADIYPDVSVAETRVVARTAQGTAIAPPLELATIIPTPIPHVTVEIRDTANRQLVTAIEVLSPTNKRGDGRQEYLAKRRRILLSTAHLLEIDLLRQGRECPCKSPYPQRPTSFFSVVLKNDRSPRSGLSASKNRCLSCPSRSSLVMRMSPLMCSMCSRRPMIYSGMIWRLITPNHRKFPSQRRSCGVEALLRAAGLR